MEVRNPGLVLMLLYLLGGLLILVVALGASKTFPNPEQLARIRQNPSSVRWNVAGILVSMLGIVFWMSGAGVWMGVGGVGVFMAGAVTFLWGIDHPSQLILFVVPRVPWLGPLLLLPIREFAASEHLSLAQRLVEHSRVRKWLRGQRLFGWAATQPGGEPVLAYPRLYSVSDVFEARCRQGASRAVSMVDSLLSEPHRRPALQELSGETLTGLLGAKELAPSQREILLRALGQIRE